jgi:hypothetical protein
MSADTFQAAGMPPRIVFVIMSAVHAEKAVEELARALAPHDVLIHHDFGQTPNFAIDASNVTFVPKPRRTGWAHWGFSEGIFHSLRHALQHLDFDYLQLLSPTCLPIKPLREFETHVADPAFDAHFDCVDVAEDLDALMSVGYRAYTPAKSIRHRVLRRLSWTGYYGSGRYAIPRPMAGVQLMGRKKTGNWSASTLTAKVALHVLQACRNPRIGHHIFDEHTHPYFGSVWFGARRHIVTKLVDLFESRDIQDYFSHLWIADEFLVPTLLRQSGARQGPSCHFVNTFIGANPAWFEPADFERLRSCSAYFARKFRDDPADPIRRRVLKELVAPKAIEPAMASRA